MNKELTHEVQEVFRQVFKRQDFILKETLTASDVPGWDSLKHILLMTELERRFKIRFTTQEILDLKNVGELLQVIKRKSHA